MRIGPDAETAQMKDGMWTIRAAIALLATV